MSAAVRTGHLAVTIQGKHDEFRVMVTDANGVELDVESTWVDDEAGFVHVALGAANTLNACQVCGAVAALAFCASCGAEQLQDWTVHTAGDSVAALVQATDEADAIRKGAQVYLAEFAAERGQEPEGFTTDNWWAEVSA